MHIPFQFYSHYFETFSSFIAWIVLFYAIVQLRDRSLFFIRFHSLHLSSSLLFSVRRWWATPEIIVWFSECCSVSFNTIASDLCVDGCEFEFSHYRMNENFLCKWTPRWPQNTTMQNVSQSYFTLFALVWDFDLG